MKSRCATPLLALFLLPCVACAENSDWLEVQSPHFTILTDAGDKRGREVAERFEQMRGVFATLILRDKVNMPVPLQIIAFRSTKELRDYAPLWKGKPIHVAGLYQTSQDRNFILLDLAVEDPYPVVFHEYAHLLLNGNYPPTQPWFDEGFAEYYSTIKIKPKDKRVEIGGDPAGALELLHGTSWMSVDSLFAVPHNSSIYNEDGDRRSLFYEESWLVVHYIFEKKLLQATGNYFALVKGQHLAIAQAMQQAYGMDGKQFDRALQDYFNGGTMKAYEFPLAATESTTYRVTKVATGDAQAVLADAHMHSPDYHEKAIAEFEQILAADPQNAAAHRGLGYGYLYKNDFARASEHFQKAAQLNPQDARVRYYAAFLLNRESAAAGGTGIHLGEMQSLLQESIELDPQFADAYNLLSMVQMRLGSPSVAIESIKKAIRLDPRNELYLANYGSYLMTAQEFDDAQAIFDRLSNSDNPQITSMVKANLELLEKLKSNPSAARVARLDSYASAPPKQEKEWGVDANGTSTATRAGNVEQDEPAPHELKPDPRPIHFIKGRLVSVDCSSAPNAMLEVMAGKQSWHMRVADAKHVVVIGADAFSCEWKNQNVAVNYRSAGANSADVVSLEIQ